MHNHISDDKLFFDPSWYREQTLNPSSEGEHIMSDQKEKKGSEDIKSDPSDEAKAEGPCCCCPGADECRLPANEWTDD